MKNRILKRRTGVGNSAETGAYMADGIKKRTVELLLTFCMVTTGSVFVCAVYNKIFWPHDAFLHADILWQLLALALMCSLGNFIHPYREVSSRRVMVDKGLHYLYINAVVLGCGYGFGWMDKGNALMLIVMMFGILLVFAVVSFVIWRLHARESENLNRKLREYQEAGRGTLA